MGGSHAGINGGGPQELSGNMTQIEYVPAAKYSYAAGQATSKFLLGLKEKKVYGRLCKKCGRIYVPPKMYCEECFRPTDEWVEVSQYGIVQTAIATFVSWKRERLETPIIAGIIRLETPREFGDSYTFPGIFHFINANYDEVKDLSIIGKRVKIVWNDERVGSILDIKYFEEVKE